jgi:hypothetical protein
MHLSRDLEDRGSSFSTFHVLVKGIWYNLNLNRRTSFPMLDVSTVFVGNSDGSRRNVFLESMISDVLRDGKSGHLQNIHDINSHSQKIKSKEINTPEAGFLASNRWWTVLWVILVH